MLRKRPLIGLCAANLFIFSAFNVRLAVQVYFATYVLQDTWALSFIGLVSIACVFPGVALVPYLTRRLGKRLAYVVGCTIWFVADLLALFVVHDTLSFVVLSCFAFFGSALPNSLNWAMVSDCVEYGEWKSGFRNQALTYSAFTWFRKLSQALAGFIPGVVLAVVGYTATQDTQSESALQGIRFLMFGYPLVMCVVAVIAILVVYNLTDQRYLHIAAELESGAQNIASPRRSSGRPRQRTAPRPSRSEITVESVHRQARHLRPVAPTESTSQSRLCVPPSFPALQAGSPVKAQRSRVWRRACQICRRTFSCPRTTSGPCASVRVSSGPTQFVSPRPRPSTACGTRATCGRGS